MQYPRAPHVFAVFGLLLGWVSVAGVSEATVGVYTYLSTQHVEVHYCWNHGRWSFRTLTHYRGVAEALSRYLDTELPDHPAAERGFVINLEDTSLTAGLVFEDSGRWQIQVSEVLDLRFFVRTLHYKASDDWHSFSGGRMEDGHPHFYKDAVQRYDVVLDTWVGEVDMSFFDDLRILVFELEDLEVVFQGGTLYYELGGVRLPEEVGYLMPVKIRNRYLLVGGDDLVVYEGGEIIARRNYPQDEGSLRCPVSDGEKVSFYEGSALLITYDYWTNTFQDHEPPRYPFDEERKEHSEQFHQCVERLLASTGFDQPSE